MDLPGWLDVLHDIEAGRIELVARDTREPSPFSHQLLNANVYAFLDDAPLEERRARAVAVRRTFGPDDVRDLGRLDPEAIAQVRPKPGRWFATPRSCTIRCFRLAHCRKAKAPSGESISTNWRARAGWCGAR